MLKGTQFWQCHSTQAKQSRRFPTTEGWLRHYNFTLGAARRSNESIHYDIGTLNESMETKMHISKRGTGSLRGKLDQLPLSQKVCRTARDSPPAPRPNSRRRRTPCRICSCTWWGRRRPPRRSPSWWPCWGSGGPAGWRGLGTGLGGLPPGTLSPTSARTNGTSCPPRVIACAPPLWMNGINHQIIVECLPFSRILSFCKIVCKHAGTRNKKAMFPKKKTNIFWFVNQGLWYNMADFCCLFLVQMHVPLIRD